MALVEEPKKGGRHTKKEQEERRLQVYHLHFEENKPATKIAELLDVHRNTINDDVKFWYGKLSDKTNIDFNAEIQKQNLQRKIQRDRLLEDLEEAETLSERLKVENMIFSLDNSYNQFLIKMKISEERFSEIDEENIEESEIKDFVRYLMITNNSIFYRKYSKKDLEIEYIRKTKCTRNDSKKFIQTMEYYGLLLCEEFVSMMFDPNQERFVYDIEKFCNLRGYLTKKEWDEYEKLKDEELEEE